MGCSNSKHCNHGGVIMSATLADIDDAIAYYKELILYQYINCTKAKNTIGLLASHALVDLCPINLNDAFDIETAQGSQLDILGEYIGFDRTVSVASANTYFNLQNQTDLLATTYGFTDYNDATKNRSYYFYSYSNSQGTPTDLIDDEYRILLKLKIYSNFSSNSLYEINNILHTYFAHNIILFDSQDMKFNYFIRSSLEALATVMRNENLLPKPMGVEITSLFSVENPELIWGIKSDTETYVPIGGFTDYNDVITITKSASFAGASGVPMYVTPTPYYNATTVYTYGNACGYVGKVYYWIAVDGSGVTPGSDPTKWSLLHENGENLGCSVGSTFTSGTTIENTMYLDFYISRGSNPIGNIFVEIWGLDQYTDFPTYSEAAKYSADIACSSLSETPGWVRFTFLPFLHGQPRYNLEANTRYAFTVTSYTPNNFMYYLRNGDTNENTITYYALTWGTVSQAPIIWRLVVDTPFIDDKIFLSYEDEM